MARFARGGFVHIGQGKWYPGEPLPRWALAIYWRSDGDSALGRRRRCSPTRAGRARADLSVARDFTGALAVALGLPPEMVLTAYEDVPRLLEDEAALPINADPLQSDLSDPGERSRLARLLLSGLDRPAGFVLPLKAAPPDKGDDESAIWETSPWPLRRERLYAVAGDSPLGLRLPLSSLPEAAARGRGNRARDRSVRAARRAAGAIVASSRRGDERAAASRAKSSRPR